MMKHFVIVVVIIFSVGCTDPVQGPPFKIVAKRDNDIVEVRVEKDMAVISVRSPSGISQAVIERTGAKWADIVMLRLYLKGLEHFKVTNNKVTLEAVVSSQDGKVREWKDGKEDSPLDSKSPHWMEIRVVGDDGKLTTTIPVKDGYFEIQLSKVLLEDNPKSITINWIDFYR